MLFLFLVTILPIFPVSLTWVITCTSLEFVIGWRSPCCYPDCSFYFCPLTFIVFFSVSLAFHAAGEDTGTVAVSGILIDTVEASGLATVFVTDSVVGTGVDTVGVMGLMVGMAVLSWFSFVGMARKDGLGRAWGTPTGWGKFGIGCHLEIGAGDLSRNSFTTNG